MRVPYVKHRTGSCPRSAKILFPVVKYEIQLCENLFLLYSKNRQSVKCVPPGEFYRANGISLCKLNRILFGYSREPMRQMKKSLRAIKFAKRTTVIECLHPQNLPRY